MYLGHSLDLSRSRDVISHVIVRSVVCGSLNHPNCVDCKQQNCQTHVLRVSGKNVTKSLTIT